jgi:hypothetical protein
MRCASLGNAFRQATAAAHPADPRPGLRSSHRLTVPLLGGDRGGSAHIDNTTDHLTELLDVLAENPQLCPHLEFETYTWEVLPPELKNESVVTQLVREYEWCLKELQIRL